MIPWGAAIGAAASIGSSAMSSGKSGKPSGSTTTSTQISDPVIRDLMGHVQSALNTNNYAELGANVAPFSSWTNAALNQKANLGQAFGQGDFSGSPGAQVLDYWAGGNFGNGATAQFANGNFSSSPGGRTLSDWAGGNFSNSPGYSGLLQTANGAYLPSQMPKINITPQEATIPSTDLRQALDAISPAQSAGLSDADYQARVDQVRQILGTTRGDTGTVSGTGNPYADALASAAANNAQSAVNSSFNSGGRYGSGANMSGLVQNVSQATNNILSPIYQQERANQLNAQGLLGNAQGNASSGLLSTQGNAASQLLGLQGNAANAITGLQLQGTDMLGSAGSAVDAFTNSVLNQPYTAMKNAFGLLQGSGGSSTTTPYFTNPFAGALGGAVGGAGLYNSLFGGGNSNTGIGSDGGFFGRLFGSGGGGADAAALAGGQSFGLGTI